ncbi:MAG: universal stress protein [Deltaproteobacteria bacterium]|nr:universal stress protein [Deltaproteobacteria bacterium]
MADLQKMVVVPLDGSENSMKSLDYLHVIYGGDHNIEVILKHVLPSLPPVFLQDGVVPKQAALKLKALKNKSIRLAERLLAEGKDFLVSKGFPEDQVKTVYREKEAGIARDISAWAESKRADAVLISTRGRSRLETFFTGEVAGKVLDYCRLCPIWIVDGTVASNKVLLTVDSSEYSLRAVDHAGFMLSGTNCQVTLFHSIRNLRGFIPQEVLEEAPELEELWQSKIGQEIAPYMKEAVAKLLEAGLLESQITTRVINGSRNVANDILKEARSGGYGTIVMGRRGLTGVRELFMGSVSRKVLQDCRGMAVWVVP